MLEEYDMIALLAAIIFEIVGKLCGSSCKVTWLGGSTKKVAI